MGWQEKVIKLLDGITDPVLRANVSSTIFFLMDVFASGKVSEEEVKGDLLDVFKQILAYKHPEWPPPKVHDEAKKLLEDIISDFRLARMTRMVMGRARARTMPPGLE